MGCAYLATSLVGVLEVASRDDTVGICEASRHVLGRRPGRYEKRKASQPLAKLLDLLNGGLLARSVLRDAYSVTAACCDGQVLREGPVGEDWLLLESHSAEDIAFVAIAPKSEES